MPESRGSVGIGLLVGLGLTIAGLMLSGLLILAGGIGFILLVGIGLGQALWIVPAFVVFKRRGEIETAKGILIAAGLVFLLNATCWGLLVGGIGSSGFH